MKVTAATLRKLSKFDTPTICNVIELFEVRANDEGYMDGRIRAAYAELPSMVGFAATASLRSAPLTQGSNYATLEAQLRQFEQLSGPAVVVFQDLDNPPVGATFGEVMCGTYKAFGAAGLVTSGGGRDLAQVRALQFPVFTATTICSHAYCRPVDVGSPVRVGGLLVSTGDLLHGDVNGVTNIPVEIAADVADVAEEYVAAEAHVIEYVNGAGEKQIDAFADRRRLMAESLAALRRRVSRKGTAMN